MIGYLLRSRSGILIFLVLIIMLLLNLFWPKYHHGFSNLSRDPILSERLSGLNDSMPHYSYKKIEDSIRQEFHAENSPLDFPRSGWSFLGFGLSELVFKEKSESKNFIRLDGYHLEQYAVWYRQNGKTMVRYFVPETKTGFTETGHDLTKETDIVFHEDQDEKGSVLVPVSKTVSIIITVLIWIFGALWILLMFNNIISRPLNVLMRIAGGDVFNEKNIASLYSLGWMLLFSGLLYGLLQIAFFLIFSSRIPPYIGFSFFDAIMSGSMAIVASMIAFLIAKAFERGYDLQQEQELTV